MMLRIWFVCSFAVVSCLATGDIKYRYFEDYLSSLNETQQASITGDDQELEEGSGDIVETSNDFFDDNADKKLPIRTGLKRSKDEMCCAIGQLAGDKGYHCYIKFYVARIMLRNRNRAHNQKMAFYGRNRITNYGTKLMRTFEQCVAGRGQLFHKCCHLAAMERKSQPHYDTWQRKKFQKVHRFKRTNYNE